MGLRGDFKRSSRALNLDRRPRAGIPAGGCTGGREPQASPLPCPAGGYSRPTMRSLDLKDGPIASVLIADELASTPGDSLDVVIRLRDGRRFVLTLFTLEHLRRQLDQALSFVTPGMLLVKHFSDEAILDAVRSAMSQDIERLGVLQPLINQ